MNKNLKLLIAAIYLVVLGSLFFVIFTYFDLKDLSSFTFIKENSQILIDFKNSNFVIFSILYFIFSVLWVLFLGFGSPIAILSGFIFGKWIGTFICVFSFTLGSSLLYGLSSYYFADVIKKYLSQKIEKYINLFKRNEFLYFMIFRLTGGGGIPFAIQNVLPVIFNMNLKNYAYATFLGLLPTVYIINSLGSGISQYILKNDSVDYLKIFFDPEIYLPILGFLIILIISFYFRNKIFKKS